VTEQDIIQTTLGQLMVEIIKLKIIIASLQAELDARPPSPANQ